LKLAGLFWAAAIVIGVLVWMVGLARAETPDYRDWGIPNTAAPDCHISAASEYTTLAAMVGIPPDAPIFAKEQSEYVTAVCLHDALGGR
jgi:hypothetical protein